MLLVRNELRTLQSWQSFRWFTMFCYVCVSKGEAITSVGAFSPVPCFGSVVFWIYEGRSCLFLVVFNNANLFSTLYEYASCHLIGAGWISRKKTLTVPEISCHNKVLIKALFQSTWFLCSWKWYRHLLYLEVILALAFKIHVPYALIPGLTCCLQPNFIFLGKDIYPGSKMLSELYLDQSTTAYPQSSLHELLQYQLY